MGKGNLYIGTSGWSYKHWKGTFYPSDIKDKDRMKYYYNYFNTVEINSSFYHLPKATTFRGWKEGTPDTFIFSVKISRFITHMKKLLVEETDIDLFMDRYYELGNKAGPVLFQLPPGWQVNIERLGSVLEMLPKNVRYTFEFRNSSWYTEKVFELLRQYNIAFCIYELAGHQSPLIVTSDFVYVRLHGPGDKYQGSYPMETLKLWAEYCFELNGEGKDIYIYFDNDTNGYAPDNAHTLNDLLKEKNLL